MTISPDADGIESSKNGKSRQEVESGYSSSSRGSSASKEFNDKKHNQLHWISQKRNLEMCMQDLNVAKKVRRDDSDDSDVEIQEDLIESIEVLDSDSDDECETSIKLTPPKNVQVINSVEVNSDKKRGRGRPLKKRFGDSPNSSVDSSLSNQSSGKKRGRPPKSLLKVQQPSKSSISLDSLTSTSPSPDPSSLRSNACLELSHFPNELASYTDSSDDENYLLEEICHDQEAKLSDRSSDEDEFSKLFKKMIEARARGGSRKLSDATTIEARTSTQDSNKPELEPTVVEAVIEDIWHVFLETERADYAMKFLVKWEGYAPKDNTNEPYDHVKHAIVLQDYVKRKFEAHDDRIERVMKVLLKSMKVPIQFFNGSKPAVIKKIAKFDILQFKCKMLAYLYTCEGLEDKELSSTNSFMKKLFNENVLYRFYKKLEVEKAANQKILDKILAIEHSSFRIIVENVVDYEPVPIFEYMAKMEYPESSMVQQGCDCKDGCNKFAHKCCPRQLGLKFVYDIDGRLKMKEHQLIIECNEFCKCKGNCLNRRKKSKIALCIFKTKDRGWALKTLEPIYAGAFVIEYIGELINEAERKKRSPGYDKTGQTYLFDLDYNENGDAPYSIDSTYKGNLSRFINHSCMPNLQTWPATSCIENRDMHRLYYFSLRHIKAGEELTVDYFGGVNIELDARTPPEYAIKCRCRSENCRGFIF